MGVILDVALVASASLYGAGSRGRGIDVHSLILVEHFADLLDQRSRRERFLQKMQTRLEHAVVRNRLVGVARHPKHASGGTRLADAIGKITAAGLRHNNV